MNNVFSLFYQNPEILFLHKRLHFQFVFWKLVCCHVKEVFVYPILIKLEHLDCHSRKYIFWSCLPLLIELLVHERKWSCLCSSWTIHVQWLSTVVAKKFLLQISSLFNPAQLLMPLRSAVSQAAPQTQPAAHHFLLAALDESQLSTQHTESRYGSCGLST